MKHVGLSPARQHLAQAITVRDAAGDRLARVNKAIAGAAQPWDLTGAAEEASEALKAARAGASHRLIAEVLGEAVCADTVPAAQQALADAEVAVERARVTQKTLNEEADQARQALDWAQADVRKAVVDVIRDEPALGELVAAWRTASIRAANLHGAIAAAFKAAPGQILPNYWDAPPATGWAPATESAAALAWKTAIAELEHDAGTLLPPVP